MPKLLEQEYPSFCFKEDVDEKLRADENRLFMQQWLQKPGQLGTLLPITVKLADAAARHVSQSDGYIVEIGAGTGRLTRSLLKYGVHPQQLTLVELEKDFCNYLNKTLPEVIDSVDMPPLVIHGDANHLKTLIPSYLRGNVSCIISAIPLMYLSVEMRKSIMDACFDVMAPNGVMYHVTYNPRSPIGFMNTLEQTRVETLWWNLPPAFVWKFTKK